MRQWQYGDKFQPSGTKGHKKLQDFFVDEKIPNTERKEIPIIVDKNDDILMIGNLRSSEKNPNIYKKIKVTTNK